MSNALIVPGMQVPAYLKALAVENTDFVGTAASVPKLSIRGSRFRLNVDGKEKVLKSLELDVIILAAWPAARQNARKFFGRAFVEGDDSSPICRSSDGVVPAADSLEPQCETCVACPHNAWGSKGGDSSAKACATHKQLFLTLPDRIETELFFIDCPITTLKNLSQYAKELSAHDVGIKAIVTTLSFEETATHPLLTFKAKRFITEEEATQVGSASVTERLDSVLSDLNSVVPAPVVPAPVVPAPVVPAPVVQKAKQHENSSIFEDDEAENVVVQPPATSKAKSRPAKLPVAVESEHEVLEETGDPELDDMLAEFRGV